MRPMRPRRPNAFTIVEMLTVIFIIGVGERPEDVQPFDPDRFVEAMFAE